MAPKKLKKREIREALAARDPIIRDFLLGRITASERERRLLKLEQEESLSEKQSKRGFST